MMNCTYCKREMMPRGSLSPLEWTRDHVHPESKGGRRTVPACWQCNNIKGDMLQDEWQAFMAANPEWWSRPQFQRGQNRAREKALPIEHTQYILKHGKEAYREWIELLASQAYIKKYGVWKPREPTSTS